MKARETLVKYFGFRELLDAQQANKQNELQFSLRELRRLHRSVWHSEKARARNTLAPTERAA